MGVPLMDLIDPAYLKAQLARLDVDLSTRASESTLAGIKAQTDKLTFDANGYLYVNASTVGNPSNLDVPLSTRASEATLSAFSGKFPDATALGDSLSNPTTTLVGSALLGWDGSYWRRIAADSAGRLKAQLDSIPNPSNLDVALSTRASESTLSAIKAQTDKLSFDTNGYMYVNAAVVANPSNLDVALSTRLSETTFTSRVPTLNAISFDLAGSTRSLLAVIPSGSPGDLTRDPTYDEVNVTTTESSISYSAPGLKLAIIINRGDDDVYIRINSPTGTQIKIPARCGKVIGYSGITAIYYVAATSSSTLVINGWS